MKIPILIFFVLIIFILSMTVTDAKRERELHITSLTIQFDKTNAIFTINYDFNKLSKLYLLMLGSKSIVPMIESVFSNFDYEIIKVDQDQAIIKVKNISRFNAGYYLHDSRKFGETINTLYMSANGETRTFYNVNSTPNFFYK